MLAETVNSDLKRVDFGSIRKASYWQLVGWVVVLCGPFVRAAFAAFGVVVVAPLSWELSAAVESFAEMVATMVRSTS